MRVCHVIHALGPGGAEQLLVDLACVAGDAGLEISVVGLVGVAQPVHADTLRDLGVPVRSLELESRWDPRVFPRGLRAIEELRPQLIHTHMKHADLVGARVSRQLGVPLVSTLHVMDESEGWLGVAKRRLAGLARNRVAARTVAVSEAQRDWYLRSSTADPSKVVTVHNGVRSTPTIDPEQRVRLRAELDVGPEAVLAVNVAIMRPGKGHEDLIDAVAQLPELSPVVVVLVGDGSERERLEVMARANPRVPSRVRFTGYRTDVAELIQAADLIVHPSHADALPTAVIQGLAASLPVIATDVGGIPEVVGADAGELVPVGDPGRLAAALSRLAGEPATRAAMGKAGRARFEAMFEAGGWALRLEALYGQVLREATTER